MNKLLSSFFVAILILGYGGALPAQGADSLPNFKMKVAYPKLAFNRPLFLCEAPDGSKRIFVVEQDGRVWILPGNRDGSEKQLFLDIADRKPHGGNEEGLLGFAFHPQFKANGKFYIYYSQQNPRRSVISEFQVSKSDPNRAETGSERVLLEVLQPYENHNGGCTIFGPDGFLYIGLGDGGAANDPHGHGQNTFTLLGKILRIDVDTKTGHREYGIPRDNPFVNTKGGWMPEIWALGLRNPWRFTFDRETGQLFAGDVGQNKWEEVDIIVKGGNYGWNKREGLNPFNTNTVAASKLIDPIIEYPHAANLGTNHTPGLSVTGGYVYRGQKIPALRGVYLYADFNFGTVWGLKYENGSVTARGVLVPQNPARQISSFGEDQAGEIFVLAFDGKIYELEDAASPAP